MGINSSLSFAINAVIATFIFTVIFTAFLPTLIDFINNNSDVLALPQVTILLVSLMLFIFVAGIILRIWNNITGNEPPNNGYPQMRGGY
jgi:hypothetical protein